MNGVVLKDLMALQELLDYCQSKGRICLNPNEWEGMFNRFRLHKNFSTKTIPNPLVLSGWTYSDNDRKRLVFLIHIYWAYRNDLLYWVDKYIKSINEDKWHTQRYPEDVVSNTRGIEHHYRYVSLSQIKQEYDRYVKTGFL
jgi:hypothetical protein